MARVPFIGRLYMREYLALFGSLILVFLEGFIRIITLGLRKLSLPTSQLDTELSQRSPSYDFATAPPRTSSTACLQQNQNKTEPSERLSPIR